MLVLDANILLRAVFGVRVRTLIEQYCDRINLLTPALCVAEVQEYLPKLCRKRAWDVGPSLDMLQSVLGAIQIVDSNLFNQHELEARRRVPRDPEDWPVVALALAVDSAIWTADADFFGCGIATWTTETIELYLRGSEAR
jgi:predicted nucleic acid-binding protein